jgi:F-type H+-transporting ATPase subunit c
MKKTGLVRRALVAGFMLVALTSVFGQVAFAQAEPAAAAGGASSLPVLAYFGAAIGIGMIVIGAALGIGRFAAAAAEGIARQPAASAQITSAVSLPLFLLEGVAIIGEVVVLLIVLK